MQTDLNLAKPKTAHGAFFLMSVLACCCLAASCRSDSSPSESRDPPGNGGNAQLNEVFPGPDSPKIQDIVSRVNPDSLAAFDNQLVAFHTRHTNSDTVSDATGIGAARRWVHSRLRKMSGGRLKVSFHTFSATILGVPGLHRNVVAELPGTVTPERKFVVSGHLDSRNQDVSDAGGFAPGANDDASGVAAILELARVFSQFEFESTLIFVAVTGEEQGLFGSRALAADFRAQGANIGGMVTNDVIGNIVGGSGSVDSIRVRCFSEDPQTSSSRQLARFMKLQGEAYVSNFAVTLIPAWDRPGRGGDHMSFNSEGFTAARLTEPEDNLNHQHNMEDLPEFVSIPYLTRVTKVNAAYLASWADAPPPPSSPTAARVSEGALSLSWQPGGSGAIANYLLAGRQADETGYDGLFSLGARQTLTFDLPESFTSGMYLSISAVDAEGNESIFSEEMKLP